jgi:hypothetical protein
VMAVSGINCWPALALTEDAVVHDVAKALTVIEVLGLSQS